MPCPTVWFNKYLSNTWEVLALVRDVRRPGEFRILCTHPRPSYAGRRHADAFEREPEGLGDAAYVDYCLEVARRHAIQLFWPGRNLLAIVRARKRFEDRGVRILAAADTSTLALLQNKARVYVALSGEDVHVPEYAVVNDLKGFDAAWQRMRRKHRVLCCKPAVSVYGIGFHIVLDDDTQHQIGRASCRERV